MRASALCDRYGKSADVVNDKQYCTLFPTFYISPHNEDILTEYTFSKPSHELLLSELQFLFI